MNNLLYLYLIEAERHRDMLAEADHYRLVKQTKKQNKRLTGARLLTWFGHLLKRWSRWLMEHNDFEEYSKEMNQIL